MGVQSSEIFTRRVSELMKKNFLTKKDMANRLNVDYSTFWRKLNGKRNVDMALLKQIAEILGTSTAYLIGETYNPIAIPQQEPRTEYITNYAYWGGIVDNSRDIVKNGDRDALVYASQMLTQALKLINAKLAIKDPLCSTKVIPEVSAYNGDHSSYTGNTLNLTKAIA